VTVASGLSLQQQRDLVEHFAAGLEFMAHMLTMARTTCPENTSFEPWERALRLGHKQLDYARRQLAPDAISDANKGWCHMPRKDVTLLMDSLDRCCIWLMKVLPDLDAEDAGDVRLSEITAHYHQIADLRVRLFGAPLQTRVM
jgi:hypothetical protein